MENYFGVVVYGDEALLHILSFLRIGMLNYIDVLCYSVNKKKKTKNLSYTAFIAKR